MKRDYYVYILCSKIGGTLYIGVTNDIVFRVWQHKNKVFEGFTSKYNVDRLVYYETFSDIETAISREKCMKKWNRQWKIRLIEERNPHWTDLYPSMIAPYVSFDC